MDQMMMKIAHQNQKTGKMERCDSHNDHDHNGASDNDNRQVILERAPITFSSDMIPNSIPNYGKPFEGDIRRGGVFNYGGRNGYTGVRVSLDVLLRFVGELVGPDFHLRNASLEQILGAKCGIRHYISISSSAKDPDTRGERHVYQGKLRDWERKGLYKTLSIDWIAGRGTLFNEGDDMEVIIHSQRSVALQKAIRELNVENIGHEDHYSIKQISLDQLRSLLTVAHKDGLVYLQRYFSSDDV